MHFKPVLNKLLNQSSDVNVNLLLNSQTEYFFYFQDIEMDNLYLYILILYENFNVFCVFGISENITYDCWPSLIYLILNLSFESKSAYLFVFIIYRCLNPLVRWNKSIFHSSWSFCIKQSCSQRNKAILTLPKFIYWPK